MTNLKLSDSHCHLSHLPNQDQLEATLKRALDTGIEHILCPAVTLEEMPTILAITQKYPWVKAAVGVQPSEVVQHEPTYLEIIDWAKHPEVVAIGEIGLDYHYLSNTREKQKERLTQHLLAAKETKKPIIIHLREAKEDLLKMVKENNLDSVGGILHCFTEDWETAQKFLDLNFYISFSGILTFANANALREVAKLVPLDRMIIETDAPYLAPVPMRGKSNEPAYLKYTAECLAKLKSISLEKLAAQTTQNFLKLFPSHHGSDAS